MSALVVLRKDLRVLRRSPFLVAALIAYPLLVALLVGLVASYASAKPRVGFVDRDGLPATRAVGGRTFDVARTIEEVSREVTLVRLTPAEARRRLDTGDVVATVTVPPGFVADVRSMARSPRLVLETTQGGLAPRVRQQVQALVFAQNRQLSDAYVEQHLGYVRLLLRGGSGTFLGQRYDVLGLAGARALLDELPPGPRLDRLRTFVRTAELALAQTDEALRAAASPIELVEAPNRGRTWALSAEVQSYALAMTLAFVTLLLAAAALAAERDENVLGRLARDAGLGSVLLAKVALAALVGLVLGVAIAVAFGVAVELGDVTGGEPWSRVPLLGVGLALAGAAFGALGCLLGAVAREARSASLVALLVVLPVVFLGLVPREIVAAAGYVSDVLPFSHAVRFFRTALYETSPWAGVAREAAWLLVLGLTAGALARVTMRRLVT